MTPGELESVYAQEAKQRQLTNFGQNSAQSLTEQEAKSAARAGAAVGGSSVKDAKFLAVHHPDLIAERAALAELAVRALPADAPGAWIRAAVADLLGEGSDPVPLR